MTSFTSIFGGIDLHRDSGNSALTLDYVGGGSFSNDGSVSNGIIQGLNFSDRLSYRRYVISLFDQFMYAPQTTLGAAGIPSGPTLPGVGTGGIGNGYLPGQSILTARGQRVTNFTGGELDYLLNSRSSLTFVGGYNLLDSLDDNQLNYGNVIFSAGYNYQMSRANTIGLSYQFSAFNYSNFDQSIKNNIIAVSYGRRITGRLAFQVSGGPDITLIKMPITSTPGSTGGAPGSSMTQIYEYFNTSLQYRLERTSLGCRLQPWRQWRVRRTSRFRGRQRDGRREPTSITNIQCGLERWLLKESRAGNQRHDDDEPNLRLLVHWCKRKSSAGP